MKELKYIKLFEAFESVALSKTLGYMESSRDREVVLNHIKNICNGLDFPYSKISDEYFEYLPFKAALKKSDILTDEACDATSARAFPDYAVPGETCQKGQIKRKWGRQIRSATCPICNGTGVKPKKGEVKLIKFWFTHDGKYVQGTCVDGLIRPRHVSSTGNLISQLRRDYVHIRTPRIYPNQDDFTNKLRSLSDGQYVLISIDGQEIYGILTRENGRTYVIQPIKDGDCPYSIHRVNGERWNSWARYSWSIGAGQFDWIRPVSLRLSDEESEKEADPYTWNTGARFTHGGVVSTGRDIENEIIKAHFALVLDLSKLKKSEYEKTSDVKSSRKERKSGALSLMTDEQIKQQNIKRYIDALASKMEIGEDLSNVKSIVRRLLGHKNAIINVKRGSIKSAINEILEGYIDLMKSSDSDKEQKLNNLNNTIKHYFTESMSFNKQYTTNLEVIKDRIKHTEPPNMDKYLKILDLLEEYSLVIYKNVMDSEIETLEDLEILYQKLLSMKNVFTSRRYNTSYLGNFIDYLSRNTIDYSYRYFVGSSDVTVRLDNIIDGLESGIKIIKKM